jgi:toxin-antitoxin system PIN domain toxin
MKLPDTNILIYAHRADLPVNAFYAPWLERLVNGASPFALSVNVAVGFVRIVTGSAFRPVPTPLDQALAFIEALASASTCRWVGAGATSWDLARDLCRATKTAGAAISDAHHAAVAIEHGCTLVSRDRDFQRFTRHGLAFELLEP